jgi:flagellin-like protein
MKVMKRTKGISPLIAAVLLIAVTMTIAGVLAFWASSFVQQGLEQSSNQTVATECNFGNFLVDACSYDAGTGRLTLILNNIATVDLKNITAYTIYPDGTLNKTNLAGDILVSGSLKSYVATGVVPGFNSISIRTHCPNVEAKTSCR